MTESVAAPLDVGVVTPVSSFKTLQVRIQGQPSNSLILSNKQTANPLNPFAKQLKALKVHTSKKTDAQYEREAEIQFHAAFYLNDEGVPVLPSTNLEYCIFDGAKDQRGLGKKFKAAVVVLDDAILEYDGPKTVEKLLKTPKFVRHDLIPGKSGTTNATRPEFFDWQAEFIVQLDTTQITVEQLSKAIEDAGQYRGIGNWRPRHGRFNLVSFQDIS